MFWPALSVMDVPDANAAFDRAQRIPTTNYGKIQVRPVVEFS